MSEKRTKYIKLRVTQSEYSDFVRRVPVGKTLSDFVRSQVFDMPVQRRLPYKRPPVDPVQQALVNQVARIGNNVNQIARKLNEGMSLEAINCYTALMEIKDELSKLLEPQSIDSGEDNYPLTEDNLNDSQGTSEG